MFAALRYGYRSYSASIRPKIWQRLPNPSPQHLKAHSHRARLRSSPSRNASTSVYGKHPKRPARLHQTRTSVNGRKRAQNRIEHGSILSASTPVDGRRRTLYEQAGFLACVPYRRRRTSTSAYARRRASTSVDAVTDVDALGVNGP